MRARMIVTLRQGVLDPAGEAVRTGLNQLGFEEVREVRIGKVIDIEVDGASPREVGARLEAMGKKLLANTVVEEFTVELG